MGKRVDNYDYYLKFNDGVLYYNNFYYDSNIDYKKLFCNELGGMNNLKKYSCSKYYAILTHKPKTYDELYDMFDTVTKFGKAVTKCKLIYVYGDNVGLEKWNDYCKKQSISNTFEYKQEKFGMTKDEFTSYNKSRSVTLDNLILRHGIEVGNCMWNDYRERQAYTNSKEYFGETKFVEVNKKKGHNYETYLLKYHDETVAIKKLEDYFSNTPSKYSKKSQELFFLLIECEQFKDKCVYFGAHNKEYGILDRELKRYYYYDFVCIDLKLSIEFHGDHYHGNPKYYMPNDMLKGRGMTKTLAKDKWEYDDHKVKLMYNDRGFDTIIIWESDYDYNKCETVDRILSYVDGRI